MSNRYSLAGRKLMITGADSGIGRQCLDDALADGAECVVLVRDAEAASRLSGVVPGERMVVSDFANADSAAPAARSAIIALGGTVDGLISCAGIFDERTALETPLADVQRILTINLTSGFEVARECGKVMSAAGHGSIVMVSSQIGVVGYPKAAAYAASKGGINSLAKTLAIELAASGVRVNAVAPGPIVTPMTEEARADEERAAAMLAAVPIGRLGETEDVSAAIQFLLSDAADFITGQVLCVDGGVTAV
ncbi:MAG: SDR family oxidoreductase [Gammaproteobacteria bacterium]|nr:SDR family oxidoreductase [Gammaproteobacteria bacterium]NND53347.1 SDR family oxidoreductase [Gammaproteobacteria bacterium]